MKNRIKELLFSGNKADIEIGLMLITSQGYSMDSFFPTTMLRVIGMDYWKGKYAFKRRTTQAERIAFCLSKQLIYVKTNAQLRYGIKHLPFDKILFAGARLNKIPSLLKHGGYDIHGDSSFSWTKWDMNISDLNWIESVRGKCSQYTEYSNKKKYIHFTFRSTFVRGMKLGDVAVSMCIGNCYGNTINPSVFIWENKKKYQHNTIHIYEDMGYGSPYAKLNIIE